MKRRDDTQHMRTSRELDRRDPQPLPASDYPSTMSLEDRLRQSVEAALSEVRARVEEELRALGNQVVATAAEERDEATTAARRAALEGAAHDAKQQVAEAEARVWQSLDERVQVARAEERERATLDVRRTLTAEADERLTAALVSSRAELKQALLQAEQRSEQAVRESVAAAQVGERERELASLTRLLESIRGLDGATTLSEVLDALAQATARESSRAAVLVSRHDRLVGWKLSGFGSRDAQPKQIDLSFDEAGIAGAATTTARPASTRDSDAARAPDFADLPPDRLGLAVPVIVGGRVVAVVYADGLGRSGQEQPVPSGWPEVVEVLARHAARCLEALTVQKAATASAPRFWVPPAKGATPQPAPGESAADSAHDVDHSVARARGVPPTGTAMSGSQD